MFLVTYLLSDCLGSSGLEFGIDHQLPILTMVIFAYTSFPEHIHADYYRIELKHFLILYNKSGR